MLNSAVNRVANGRRLAARRVVMKTLASVPAQVWRKRVVYNNASNPDVPADPLSFEANAVSVADEPNYEYDHLGFAYVLADKFNGGAIHKNKSMVNPSDLTILAQIELYDEDLSSLSEKIKHIPEGVTLNEGDLLGLMIYDGFMVWFEIVGITGQTMMADFGAKYMLNRRDELGMPPINGEVVERAVISCGELIQLERGEILSLSVQFNNEADNEPITITSDMTITATVSTTNKQLIATLQATPDSDQVNSKGEVLLGSLTTTQDWQLGDVRLDIVLKQGDVVLGDQVMFFKVVDE